MADARHDPARTPKLGFEGAANLSDRSCNLGAELVARANGRLDALRQILHAITCAGKLVTAAHQVRDAADHISSDELHALLDVLDTEFRRRLRIAKAAVPRQPTAHTAGQMQTPT